MFQTTLHHFLQQFGASFWSGCMKGISLLGEQYLIIPLLILLMYAIDFRKGFVLIQCVGWAGIWIPLFKNVFALPRPYHVDPGLNAFGASDTAGPGPFLFDLPAQFFGRLPSDTVEVLRTAGIQDFGFPSGHVCFTLVFFGALMFLFPKKWLAGLSCFFILAMPVSRMYLARHFLADVLGGFLLGGLILLPAVFLILRPEKLSAFLSSSEPGAWKKQMGWKWWGMLLILPLCVLCIPGHSPESVASLTGFNLAFLAIVRKQYPKARGGTKAAWFRSLLMLLLVLGMVFAGRETVSALENSSAGIRFLLSFAGMFLPVLLGTRLCERAGWYEKNEPEQAGKINPLDMPES